MGSLRVPIPKGLIKIYATQGAYPNISIDYSKVLFSKGLLEPTLAPMVSLAGNLLTFTWAVGANMDWGIKNDRAMLLVYCPELNKVVYVLSGARRSNGGDEIELPTNFVGKELHCFIITFTESSNDNREVVFDRFCLF